MTDTTNTQEPGPTSRWVGDWQRAFVDEVKVVGWVKLRDKARAIDQQLADAITRADELERDRDRWKERVVSERDAHALRYAAWNEERNTLTHRAEKAEARLDDTIDIGVRREAEYIQRLIDTEARADTLTEALRAAAIEEHLRHLPRPLDGEWMAITLEECPVVAVQACR